MRIQKVTDALLGIVSRMPEDQPSGNLLLEQLYSNRVIDPPPAPEVDYMMCELAAAEVNSKTLHTEHPVFVSFRRGSSRPRRIGENCSAYFLFKRQQRKDAP